MLTSRWLKDVCWAKGRGNVGLAVVLIPYCPERSTVVTVSTQRLPRLATGVTRRQALELIVAIALRFARGKVRQGAASPLLSPRGSPVVVCH